jgi:hypothetical protein
MAEEWGEYRRGNLAKLHDTCNLTCRQRIDVQGDSEQHSWDSYQRSRHSHGESGRSTYDHNSASQPESERWAESKVHRTDGRVMAVWLPVAEEWSKHRWSHSGKLQDAGYDSIRQRINV